MWILVISLLLTGLLLILVELIFIPGTTIVGLLGLGLSIAGIVISYQHFGSETGNYILMGMLVVTAVGLVYGFRSKSWTAFSLKSAIDSKVNEGMIASLKVGDEGQTISTLRPVGKAEFKEGVFEVKAMGGYVMPGTKVKIIQLQANQIIVEPII